MGLPAAAGLVVVMPAVPAPEVRHGRRTGRPGDLVVEVASVGWDGATGSLAHPVESGDLLGHSRGRSIPVRGELQGRAVSRVDDQSPPHRTAGHGDAPGDRRGHDYVAGDLTGLLVDSEQRG